MLGANLQNNSSKMSLKDNNNRTFMSQLKNRYFNDVYGNNSGGNALESLCADTTADSMDTYSNDNNYNNLLQFNNAVGFFLIK